MDDKKLFLIGDLPGFTPQISRLVSMMNYTRHTTLSTVQGLETRHLDYLPDAQSNSIGALLLHIASVEVAYQADTFSSRNLNEEEMREWEVALTLGEKARSEIRGYDLDYYLEKLRQVRLNTLAELAQRTDEWLDEETQFWGERAANNYFKWFHVFEDELNHRGQIRWLSSRARKNS
jgi:uncharacterized damage-inducible protein DinB